MKTELGKVCVKHCMDDLPFCDCQPCVIGARLRSWEPGCVCLSGGGGGMM